MGSRTGTGSEVACREQGGTMQMTRERHFRKGTSKCRGPGAVGPWTGRQGRDRKGRDELKKGWEQEWGLEFLRVDAGGDSEGVEDRSQPWSQDGKTLTFVLGGHSGWGVRTVRGPCRCAEIRQEAPVETRRHMADLEGTGASHEKVSDRGSI